MTSYEVWWAVNVTNGKRHSTQEPCDYCGESIIFLVEAFVMQNTNINKICIFPCHSCHLPTCIGFFFLFAISFFF